MTIETPPTLAEYRAMTLTRPLTDRDSPIGTHTARKRAVDAEHSQFVTEQLGYVPPANPGPPSISDPPACGTASGYRRHRTEGTEACHACKVAHAAYQRRRKAARTQGVPE